MVIKLPQEVRTILHTLQRAGYEAYAVGGCVRDSLLGRTPEDWDITTQAKPEAVSYTHLDVYKRQLCGRCGNLCGGNDLFHTAGRGAGSDYS